MSIKSLISMIIGMLLFYFIHWFAFNFNHKISSTVGIGSLDGILIYKYQSKIISKLCLLTKLNEINMRRLYSFLSIVFSITYILLFKITYNYTTTLSFEKIKIIFIGFTLSYIIYMVFDLLKRNNIYDIIEVLKKLKNDSN